MARQLVPVGFGSVVIGRRVVAVLNPAGSSARRMRDDHRDRGLLVDATQGRKTRSLLLLDSGHLLLSAVQVETVAQRLARGRDPLDPSEDDTP